MWGHSPALDLLSQFQRVKPIPEEGELRILLIGSMDGRHILQTIASWNRHRTGVRLAFYVLDMVMELVARQMMLLTIALEPEDKLGLHEKARLWMEVYGNTLLRPTTARYLIHKAAQMVRMVTDKKFRDRRMAILDLDHLKYKELDQLENIFKYWIQNKHSLAKIWDLNLRRHLGTRYDHRNGVYDWDYNMKLIEIDNGKRVCLAEYRNWRETGIAFTWLETEHSVSNPTLAVGIGVYGDQLYSHGYIGDWESGPFFTFGTESEEKEMLKTTNGYNHRRATDITERNLQRIFYEIQTGSPPTDLFTADIDMGLVMTNPTTVNLENETNLEYEPDKTPEDYSAIPTNHKVTFLPSNALESYVNKPKYQEFFDMIYIAQNYFKYLSPKILAIAKCKCPIIIQTRKFVIAYDKKIGEFEREVKDQMKMLGGKEVSKCHYRRHSYALYKINITSDKEDTEDDDDAINEDKNSATDENVDVSSSTSKWYLSSDSSNNSDKEAEFSDEPKLSCEKELIDVRVTSSEADQLKEQIDYLTLNMEASEEKMEHGRNDISDVKTCISDSQVPEIKPMVKEIESYAQTKYLPDEQIEPSTIKDSSERENYLKMSKQFICDTKACKNYKEPIITVHSALNSKVLEQSGETNVVLSLQD